MKKIKTRLKKALIGGAYYALIVQLIGFMVTVLCFGCVTRLRLLNRERYWEKFPEPPGRSQGVSWIGEDDRGCVWIMSGQGAYSWDAAEKRWIVSPLRTGQYLTRLYGGAKTGLYATQRGKEEHWGEIFLLDKDLAKYVTQFYFDVAHAAPGFYVVGKDRFLNWGGGKLRIYAKGKWIELSADLPQTGTLVFDGGRCVSLYADGRLYVVDRHSNVAVRELDARISRKANKGALWGGDKALVLEYGAKGVTGFDIFTGRRVDTQKINQSLGDSSVYDLFSTPDGDVWVMAHDRALASYVLYRIRPDGTTALVPDTAGIPWDNHQFTHSPRSVLMRRHGAVWFASHDIGVFCLTDGIIRQFDHRTDGSPAACEVLLQGRNGVVYAGSENGLYAYNNGRSLTGAAPTEPTPTVKMPASAWRHVIASSDRLRAAWYVNDMVVFVSRHGRTLTALNAADGGVRFSIPLSDDDVEQAWVTAGSDKTELTICLRDRTCAIDAATGTILRNLETKRDRRLAPIAVGNDYILVKQYRGSTVSRVKASGEDVWTRPLSGYVMTHPSAFGPLLLVQTRQGSYGGQASHGIDGNSGELLWSDIVNAYGAGTAFADDATYCVESDSYLAPDTTEAWLIARDPRTGVRRWHYRKPGTTVGHAPLVDRAKDRVYGALCNGTIVCLNGVTGEPVWETLLPEPPVSAPAASYEPYVSCMLLSSATVAILAADQMLYLVNTKDGSLLHRIALTEDTIMHGKWVGVPPVIAGPWLAGKVLIIATESGITAYSLASLDETKGVNPFGTVP